MIAAASFSNASWISSLRSKRILSLPKSANQLCVFSATHRCLPNRSLLSMPRLAIHPMMPRCLGCARHRNPSLGRLEPWCSDDRPSRLTSPEEMLRVALLSKAAFTELHKLADPRLKGAETSAATPAWFRSQKAHVRHCA